MEAGASLPRDGGPADGLGGLGWFKVGGSKLPLGAGLAWGDGAGGGGGGAAGAGGVGATGVCIGANCAAAAAGVGTCGLGAALGAMGGCNGAPSDVTNPPWLATCCCPTDWGAYASVPICWYTFAAALGVYMPGVCTEIEGISKAAVVPPPSIVFCKLPPRYSTKTSLLVYLAAAAMTCSRSSSNSLILLVDSANCLSFCASFSCASASICLILACATVSSFFSCFSLASAASACGDVQKARVRVRSEC